MSYGPPVWAKGEPHPADVWWREDLGLWWPVADRKWETAPAFVAKRVADSDLAVRACRRTRTCVQAGGYVGLWPARLARSFDRVLTFEIMPGCHEACRRNTAHLPNVTLSPLGLGAAHGVRAAVLPKGTAGSWRIDPEGELAAEMTSIDHLALDDCDAIILDVEGYEVEALTGAADTIARCRPVIMVEELERSRAGIQAHLAGLGYRRCAKAHKDVVYLPGERA